MSLYHKKQRWKIALLGFALILIFASLWFSYTIVQKVQAKEVDRINQWAEAVQRKSNLVKLTNQTFDELGAVLQDLQEKERRKVEIWSLTMAEINKSFCSDYDYSYLLTILRDNDKIPMILTDLEENIVGSYNVKHLDESIKTELGEFDQEGFKKAKEDSLTRYLGFWRELHEPIIIDLYADEKQKIFYFDSVYYQTQKLIALERSRDSLVDAFTNELVTNEYLVPVMFIDQQSREMIATNIPDFDATQRDATISRMVSENDSILVDLGVESKGVIYYEHSAEVTQLKYFPFILFFIIGLFILIAYIAFSTFRKAEQDQVWAGMAKETAHQLGTPISSLMAWNELLISQGIDPSITSEIDKDLSRLKTVTDRFSKIGSDSLLKEEDIVSVVKNATEYLRMRVSDKVSIEVDHQSPEIKASVNIALMEWVIENIVKNAVDAMESKGNINVSIYQKEDEVFIDIKDNGKGIEANKIKAVFEPGYTTKKRGWGLGLSLVKRIVEEFHKGKVFVAESEVNIGTTFRIILKV